MKKLFILLSVGILSATSVFALEDENARPSPWRSKTTYGQQAGSKFIFGAKNFLLGWTELISEPIEEKSVTAIPQGLGNAVMDTVGGLLHVLTAPLTNVDVPLPENGTSIGSRESSVKQPTS